MTTPPPPHRRGWRHSLVQALIAVAFVAGCAQAVFLLSTLIGIPVSIAFEWDSKQDRARLDLRNIHGALKLYRERQGRYPTTEEGLGVLVSSQMLESFPRDPWNAEYHYALREGVPVVWSNGADGLPGGGGADADIYH